MCLCADAVKGVYAFYMLMRLCADAVNEAYAFNIYSLGLSRGVVCLRVRLGRQGGSSARSSAVVRSKDDQPTQRCFGFSGCGLIGNSLILEPRGQTT
jgi:hypothetical protein